MTSLLQVLLPVRILMYCLNTAVASLIAGGIAVTLSRGAAWSLPARHAVLVAAFAVSLTAPFFVPLFHPASVWSIIVAAKVEPSRKSALRQPIEANHLVEAHEPPVVTAAPVAEVMAHRPADVEPAGIVPVSVVPERTPLALVRERKSLTTIEWASVFGTLLCGVWLIGTAAGMVWSIAGLVRLQRLLQTVAVANNPLLTAAARWAADGVGLPSAIPIYHSNLLPAPVTFGLLHASIFVPTGLETSVEPDQLRAVIQHEAAHIARRDLWIGLLQRAVAIVYWWNPLIRLANRQLADLREHICDDIAIRELPEPEAYAATLISLAERCSLRMPVPATLGIGSSPAGQLESRIRRIVSSRQERCLRLTRRAMVGVSAAAILMTATILLAQVQVKSAAIEKPDDQTKTPEPKPPIGKSEPLPAAAPAKAAVAPEPTLSELIRQMAAYERMYLPYDIKAMESFRFPDDLTPQERAKNLRADGRKHQRLMEYAQLARRIWRDKETDLVDDEIEQGPYERLSDGERIVQASPGPAIINGKTTLEIYVNNKQNQIFNYLLARPLVGVFCLSAYGGSELFSEVFKADEESVELAWDNGDAKLTFGLWASAMMKARFVLWLNRAHDWHPIRLQRYWDCLRTSCSSTNGKSPSSSSREKSGASPKAHIAIAILKT